MHFKKTLLLCFLCIAIATHAQNIVPLIQKEDVSFRGLESYKNHCIWVSGSKGTVGKSADKGQTWEWVSPVGYEDFDFRDIEVFNEKEALVLSAGSPAVMLRTSDGGRSWQEVYRDERPDIFLDGMDFKGSEGFVIGDPIDGLFQQLQSKDKGKTWKDVSNFMFFFADEGEAAFAASGTSVLYLRHNVWLGTGGASANLFRRNERKRTMFKMPCPIQQGVSSKGIFSIDFYDDNVGVVVGGDYMNDTDNSNNVFLTYDGGQNWTVPIMPVGGYRSCVKYMTKDVLVATGTSGTDISCDGGKTWKNISKESYNVLSKDKSNKTVYLASSDGIISKMSL